MADHRGALRVPHTFLDVLELPPLPHADGRSLMPLLHQPDRPDWEDAVLCVGYGCEFFVTQRMVITDRWKYVFNGFDFDEMYDLIDDPDEMHNRIDDPACATTRSKLRAKLYELMDRFEDTYGDNPFAAACGGGDRINRYSAPRYLPRH